VAQVEIGGGRVRIRERAAWWVPPLAVALLLAGLGLAATVVPVTATFTCDRGRGRCEWEGPLWWRRSFTLSRLLFARVTRAHRLAHGTSTSVVLVPVDGPPVELSLRPAVRPATVAEYEESARRIDEYLHGRAVALHVALPYRPGGRDAARALFPALGCLLLAGLALARWKTTVHDLDAGRALLVSTTRRPLWPVRRRALSFSEIAALRVTRRALGGGRRSHVTLALVTRRGDVLPLVDGYRPGSAALDEAQRAVAEVLQVEVQAVDREATP